jgi:hypothetical protein
MKEDILEQMVDDWLLTQSATFTKHNLKYKPLNTDEGFNSNSDAVNSDIDVLAVNLNKTGAERVRVISCKSYQYGFNPEHWFHLLSLEGAVGKDKIVSGRPAWKHHRELCIPKWGKALARKVKEETMSSDFTWILVVTKLQGENAIHWKNKFESNSSFIENLKLDATSSIKIEIITVSELVKEYLERTTNAGIRISTTVESTQFGRLLQVLTAAEIELRPKQ